MLASILVPNTGPEDLAPPLQLFRFADLEAELDELEHALPAVTPAFDASDDEWNEIMNALLAVLERETGTPFSATGRKLLSSLPASSATYLLAKLQAVYPALETTRHHGNTQFPQTHFLLLPQQFHLRMAHVIGHGQLPLAWIQSIDIPCP